MSDAPTTNLARAEIESRGRLTAISPDLTSPQTRQAKDSMEQTVEVAKQKARHESNWMYHQKWPVQPELIPSSQDTQQGSHGLSGQAPK